MLAALVIVALAGAALSMVAMQPVPSLTAIFMLLSALTGAARAFLQPAATAMEPMLVSRSDMPQAITLVTLMWTGSVIIGPSVGGLLLTQSVALSFAATTALYLLGMASILRITANTTPERQEGHPLVLLREGLVYVWQNRVVFGAISLDLVAVLLDGATALLPAFATDILHVGPTGFGILRAGPAIGGLAIGGLAMAAWLSWFPIKRHAGVKMFLGVAAFGLATAVFGFSRSMPLSLLALAIPGAGDMISVTVRQTLVQIVTPDPMRGRVSAVSTLFISGSNQLGEFESGVVSRFVGPVVAAVAGGIGTLIVTGLWALWFPDLRKADRIEAIAIQPANPEA